MAGKTFVRKDGFDMDIKIQNFREPIIRHLHFFRQRRLAGKKYHTQ
jgi:hypothetical protein